MYVFRSERRLAPGKELLAGLRSALSSTSPVRLLDALLRAGELECAVTDGSPNEAQFAAVCAMTDALANRLLQPSDGSADGLADLVEKLTRIELPERLCVSKPEGFAYYGLHPLDYARLADSFCGSIGRAAVIGLRSIGTTLSAVVAAAFRRRGIAAERITTRPYGHPFDRQSSFSAEQLQWIGRHVQSSAHFFVVDEGPGLSGSSLLSVAEALLAAGVPSDDVTIFCGHQPDVERLRARDAARRWRSFHSKAIACGERKPDAAGDWLGAGLWRGHILLAKNLSAADWPASWTHMERAKYLACDGTVLYKFEGLGRYGEEVVSRSEQLAEAGFAPRLLEARDEQGYVGYERMDGAGLPCGYASSRPREEALERLAGYCAMRAREFACDVLPSAPEEVSLQEMCRVNAAEEFGVEIDLGANFFSLEQPVIADGRIMPHEWIETPSGSMVKTDGAGHGDDHFFPGPCDIAWDLAGAIVEWKLSPGASDFLVRAYRRLSGDDAGRRLGPYLLAYALFRMGYSKMASEAMQGSEEEARLRRAFASYREAAEKHLFHALRCAQAPRHAGAGCGSEDLLFSSDLRHE